MEKKRSRSSDSSILDRKTIEKNRRKNMKDLCFKLSSLIPPQQNSYHKKVLKLPDQLDQATDSIKKLCKRIEELKARKQFLMGVNGINSGDSMATNLTLPVFELREFGKTVEVILVSGLSKKFMLYEVISILEEGGLQVVNVSLCTVGDKIFHTIFSQEKSSRIGVELSRVGDRLMELVC